MASIKELVAKLKLDSADFEKGISKGTVATTAFSAAVGALAISVISMAQEFAKLEDESIKMARSIGESVEEFSKLRYAAGMSGIETESFAKSMKLLSENSEETRRKLAVMGVTSTDVAGHARSHTAVLADLADKFQKITDPVKRSQAAIEVFGAKGANMVNILKDGAKGLLDLTLEAERYGSVITTQAAEASELYQDNLERSRAAVDGLKRAVSDSIIEFINQGGVMQKVDNFLIDLRKGWENLSPEVKTFIITTGAVVAVLSAVVAVIGAVKIAIQLLGQSIISLVTNPFGLVLLAAAAVVTIFILMGDETSKLVNEYKKMNSAVNESLPIFEELSKKQNKNAVETHELAKAQDALLEIAIAAGKGTQFLNSSYEDQAKLIRSITEEKRKEMLAKAEALEAEIKNLIIQKEINLQRELMDQKIGTTTGMIKQMASAITGNYSLMFSETILTNKKLTETQENLKKIRDAIGDVKKKFTTEGGFNFDKGQIHEMTDFLVSEYTKAFINIQKQAIDYYDGIASMERKTILNNTQQSDLIRLNALLAANVQRDKLLDLQSRNELDKFRKFIEDESQLKRDALTKESEEALKAIDFNKENELRKIKEKYKEMGSLTLGQTIDMLKEENAVTEKANQEKAKVSEAVSRKSWAIIAEDIKKTISEITSLAGSIASVWQQFTDLAANKIKREEEIRQRDFEVQKNQMKKNYDEQRAIIDDSDTQEIQNLKDKYDAQLQLLKDQQDAEATARDAAANERLLAMDDEFQAAKAKMQADFEERMAIEAEQYAERQAVIDQETVDKEQRQLIDTMNQAAWDAYAEQQKQINEQNLANLAKTFADKRKGINDSLNDAVKISNASNAEAIKKIEDQKATDIAAAEKKKTDDLATIDKKFAADSAELDKKSAQSKWDAEVAQFEATKNSQIASLIITSINAAASAFANLASIPVVGWALGIAAAGAIGVYMYEKIDEIRNSVPIKPASLMAEGGFLGGNFSHAMGGIPLTAESGEVIIDRERTAKLYDSIDNQRGKTVQISFESGAIVISKAENIDEITEAVSVQMGKKLRGAF